MSWSSSQIRPVGRLDHPVDHPQRGGLAASGRAYQHGDLAGRSVRSSVVYRDRAVGITLGHRIEPDHEQVSSMPVGNLVVPRRRTGQLLFNRGATSFEHCSITPDRGCVATRSRTLAGAGRTFRPICPARRGRPAGQPRTWSTFTGQLRIASVGAPWLASAGSTDRGRTPTTGMPSPDRHRIVMPDALDSDCGQCGGRGAADRRPFAQRGRHRRRGGRTADRGGDRGGPAAGAALARAGGAGRRAARDLRPDHRGRREPAGRGAAGHRQRPGAAAQPCHLGRTGPLRRPGPGDAADPAQPAVRRRRRRALAGGAGAERT